MAVEKEVKIPEFDWKRIGDIDTGRKTLGPMAPLSIYRLMQFTIFDCLEAVYGTAAAQNLFRKSGYSAGAAFAKKYLDLKLDFDGLVAQLQTVLKEQAIGILKIEKSNADKSKIVLTLSEDLDCSGLPVTGETACQYDEGFVAGVLKTYTGADYRVEEIDCWATGDKTCRFAADKS